MVNFLYNDSTDDEQVAIDSQPDNSQAKYDHENYKMIPEHDRKAIILSLKHVKTDDTRIKKIRLSSEPDLLRLKNVLESKMRFKVATVENETKDIIFESLKQCEYRLPSYDASTLILIFFSCFWYRSFYWLRFGCHNG